MLASSRGTPLFARLNLLPPIPPYKPFAMFAAISKVSLRQGEGILLYKYFYCLRLVIKSDVGNGLDRSDNDAQIRTIKRKYSRYSAYTLL